MDLTSYVVLRPGAVLWEGIGSSRGAWGLAGGNESSSVREAGASPLIIDAMGGCWSSPCLDRSRDPGHAKVSAFRLTASMCSVDCGGVVSKPRAVALTAGATVLMVEPASQVFTGGHGCAGGVVTKVRRSILWK